ncbi:MAG: hypothetical protein H6835_10900 [Planctomycetes bacterium]|nr:hypothetical protein [Planctomycetota bacterium]
MGPGRNVWLLAVALATWSDVAAQTRWSLATPQLPFLGACAASYDAGNHRSLVYVSSTAQTWSLASATGAWQLLAGSAGAPPFVTDPALAWDAQRQRLVLFGGRDFIGQALTATWEFDGVAWSSPSTPTAPPARFGAAFAHDPVLGVLVLAGGEAGGIGGQTPLADAWTWDGHSWTAVAGAATPSGAATAAWDAARGELVVCAPNGTFRWHSGSFSLAANVAASPPPRRQAAMVYDAARQRIVLHGGTDALALSLADVWEFDGAGWTQQQPGGVPPPPHSQHAMTYDSLLSVTRVFAGNSTTLGSTSTTTVPLAEERHYEPTFPAAALQLTPGCALPRPILTSGLPWLGDTLTLSLPLAAGAPAALFVFGLAPLAAPFPIGSLGFPQCSLLVTPDLLMVAPLGPNGAEIVWLLPSQPSALGAQVFVQAFDFTAAKASNELLLLFGGR